MAAITPKVDDVLLKQAYHISVQNCIVNGELIVFREKYEEVSAHRLKAANKLRKGIDEAKWVDVLLCPYDGHCMRPTGSLTHY